MFNFLHSIFSETEPSGDRGYDDRLLDAATERLVDATDPRLRVVSGYKRKLRAGVERAVDHAVHAGDALSAPLELSRSAFGRDPRVRAMFASAEHLEETLNTSTTIRQWLEHADASLDTVYALLVVNWAEQQTFGMELEGDIVRRDVAQVVVNFGNHRFPAVAGQDVEVRREVKKLAFDLLVKAALARLVSQRGQRRELERERLLLSKKLNELDAAHVGLKLDATPQAAADDPAAAAARLAQIESELSELRAEAGTLDDHLKILAATLSQASEHLTLAPVSFVLDHRNVKRSKPDGETIHAVVFQEARADNRHALVMLVQFPRASIHPIRGLGEWKI